MLYFFWQVATPTVPKSSLLNNIPDNADIARVLGEQEASYARSNYSRQNFDGGAMSWWDNPNNNFGLFYLLPGDPQTLSGTNWARYKDNWSPIYDPEVPARCPEASGPARPHGRLLMLFRFLKNERDNLTPGAGEGAAESRSRGVSVSTLQATGPIHWSMVMKDELFNELMESVRQGGAILRGEMEPSRAFDLDEAPDVASVREQLGLSQPKMAALMGISVGTLRNWEQGRRRPEGPARALLRVAAKHPEAVLDSVRGMLLRGQPG
jgi:putative transcriptional regulator